jgi:hypothetical protein
MAQVEVKINSVDFICDWKYNIKSENMECCFCSKHSSREYISKSQRKCSLKVYGLVSGKCGHIAHLSCYKSKLNRHNKYGITMHCGNCIENNIEETEFVFDKNLETVHIQKLYKV